MWFCTSLSLFMSDFFILYKNQLQSDGHQLCVELVALEPKEMKPLMVTDDGKEQGCWRLCLCSHSCSIAQSFNPPLTRALVKNSFPGCGCYKLANSQLSLSITYGFLTALPSYLIVCWCTHMTSRYLQALMVASFVPALSSLCTWTPEALLR